MYMSGPFIQKQPYPGTEEFRWGVNGVKDARNKESRIAWVKATKLEDFYVENPKPHMRICWRHFRYEDLNYEGQYLTLKKGMYIVYLLLLNKGGLNLNLCFFLSNQKLIKLNPTVYVQ